VEVTLKRMWPGDLSDNYPTRGRMRRGFWLTAFTRGQNETRGLNFAGIVAWRTLMPFWATTKDSHDWEFAEGEAEFKKSFELDPSDATAHQWYAQVISGIGGREQEALAEINRAHQLDPLSPIISLNVCGLYIDTRQYDRAIQICKKVADDNPTFAEVHSTLAFAYWGKRMYPEVIEEFNEAKAEYAKLQ
jgi:tetratricopeptide (TPR) repeat protein